MELPNISTFNVENKKNTIKVDVIDKKRCIHYYGLSISNVKVSTSPNWLTNKLNSIGITPKNNIVDLRIMFYMSLDNHYMHLMLIN